MTVSLSSNPSENSYPLSEAESNQFCVGDTVLQVPQKHFTMEVEYLFQVSKQHICLAN